MRILLVNDDGIHSPGPVSYTHLYADKIGAQYTIVLGENELAQGKAELKNMKTGEKKDISLGEDFIDQYITLSTQAADLAF